VEGTTKLSGVEKKPQQKFAAETTGGGGETKGIAKTTSLQTQFRRLI